jgi:hypothetical protein
MSRKLYVVIAVVALGALAATGAVVAGASTSGSSHGRTLHLVIRGGTSTFVDVGKKGPSIGDEVILRQNAYLASAPSHRVGTGIVKITLLGGTHTNLTQDEANVLLPAGQIAVEGIQTSNRSFSLAVTGGTGAYRNAHGQANVTLGAHNTSRVTIQLG